MTEFETLRADLDGLAGRLAELRTAAETGAFVDLAGLPEETEALCHRAGGLTKDEGRALIPALAVLVAECNALALHVARTPPRSESAATAQD